MKSSQDIELMDLVQRIENDAAIKALDEVLSKLDRKADLIKHLLWSDESRYITNQSRGKRFNILLELRSKLHHKQRTIYQIAGIIYDIKSRYLNNIEVAPDTYKGIRL